MCGIAGFITKDGKKPSCSPKQLAKMLIAASSRGKHATGIYWSSQYDDIVLKLPIAAKEFIKNVPWSSVKASNICLMHTRHATQGNPKHSFNNHPLQSNDENLILIHNGIISNSYEYVASNITDSYSILESYS